MPNTAQATCPACGTSVTLAQTTSGRNLHLVPAETYSLTQFGGEVTADPINGAYQRHNCPKKNQEAQ